MDGVYCVALGGTDAAIATTEWPAAFYIATLTLINGMIEQGAVDRGKIVIHIENIIAGLSPTERQTPYGLAMQQALNAIEDLQDFKTPEV